MKSLESAPRDIDPRIQNILDAPPSSNYNYRQMQLSVARFVRRDPAAEINHATITQAAEEWTSSGDSEKFSELSKESRFHGDVSNITIEDMDE